MAKVRRIIYTHVSPEQVNKLLWQNWEPGKLAPLESM